VPYLTAKNIKDGNLDLTKTAFISEEAFSKYFRASERAVVRAEPEDVIFGIIGSIGEAYEVRLGDRFGMSSSIAILRPDRSHVDPEFLLRWVQGEDFQTALYNIKGGVAQSYVSLEMIRSLPIKLPPLPTQRRIAAILSTYDDLIEHNTRRSAILEEMARRLYEEWFVHFRFPGHEGVRMVDSEIGKVPEGWTVRSLAEVAAVNARSIRKGNAPQEINYIDIKSVDTGRVEYTRQMPFADAPSRARRIVKSGDIIWSAVRPNLRAYALIVDPQPNTIASTGFAVVSPTEAPFSFIYPALTSDEFVGYLVNHATGAAYPAVNQKDFEVAKLTVPPVETIEVYDQLVRPMLVLAHRLEVKNTNLRSQRDLLLPKLISGEIDVSEAHDQMAEVAAE